MSQPYPTPPQPGYAHPGTQVAQRTSAAAITSLITGILGCLIITGLIAVITGIVGLKATKNPNVKGRGMAIAGLILGILGLIGGGGCLVMSGAGLAVANREIDQVASVVDAAVAAAAANDDAKFRSYWDSNAVPPNDFVASVRAWGTPGKFEWTYNGVQVNAVNGVATTQVHGTINFANHGNQKFVAQAVKKSDAAGYKLTALYPE